MNTPIPHACARSPSRCARRAARRVRAAADRAAVADRQPHRERSTSRCGSATIAEFEAANPGHQDRAGAGRAQGPLDQVRRRRAGAARRRASSSVDLTTAAYNGYLLPLDKYWNAEPAELSQRMESDDMLNAIEVEGPALRPADLGRHVRRDLQPRPRGQGRASTRPSRRRPVDEYLAWAKKLTGNDHWATAVLGGKTDTTTRVLLTWIWANGGEAFNADMTEATFAKNPKSLEAIKYVSRPRQGRASPRPRRPRPTISSRPTCSRRARSRRCATPTGRSPRWSATTRR